MGTGATREASLPVPIERDASGGGAPKLRPRVAQSVTVPMSSVIQCGKVRKFDAEAMSDMSMPG